jgi:diguanylate cyclase (GGDEF)-like protein/PAS domain S-box-containing protein
MQSIRNAHNLGLTIALGGMTIIAVIGVLMGFVLTRRLEQLARTAQRLADGELNAETGLHGNDEVAAVGRAFDQMARKIQNHIAEIRESSQRFALAVSGTNDGIWDWKIDTGATYFSPRCKAILGYDEDDEEFTQNITDWKDAIHPDDREQALVQLGDCLFGNSDFFTLEHRLRKKSGEYVWVLMRGKALRDADGKAVRMTGSLTDITQRKHQEFTIQYQALHDPVTSLPNRALLHDRLQHAMLVAQREGKTLALLMMDLDRFKEINDTLGHHIGDLVLQQVALRLQTTLRGSDTVSRFGGDEFCLLLPVAGEDYAVVVVNSIAKALQPPLMVEGHTLHIEASIGVALFPDHGKDATTLLKLADIAMYAAKRGDTGYAIYEASQDRHSAHRLAMRTELRRAIDEDELVLHYQPKLDMDSGRVCGVEALVRWQHPDHGLILPEGFIPFAEQSGLINHVTTWVLDAVIHQHHLWQQREIRLPVAINLSGRNLQDLAFPAEVERRLANWNIAPNWLAFEITESAIIADPIRALKILTQLNEMGVRLSIDDFGIGYSSLAYLKRLPVDELKIDKSFVIEMNQNESNAVIVRSTIDLGHNLGLRVVAEGVETTEIRQTLERMGCDVLQGIHISPPLTSEALVEWLATRPEATSTSRRRPSLLNP